MKILALESSATAASVAICEGETLIAQTFQNSGFTHSQTLLPMTEALLAGCGYTLGQMDMIAVAVGPGSFTGLRIGVAAAKGLAWAADLPCAACSTLESMAWNLVGIPGEICTAMDARRNEIYHARFQTDGETLVRLSEDCAIALAALEFENAPMQTVVGDGANLCYGYLKERGISVRLAPPHLRMQTAWGVARAGL
ncbi:MAG: tRNA (adenosine(37)-N6)-threonylcarbamoyltransferase complex dimerization subunit type 1 TsaB, partial [Evtepia sp.]